MAKWRYREGQNTDHLEKVGKIRKSRARKKYSDRAEDFELPESEWSTIEGEGLFKARVVEVHKRYAFVSVEEIPLQINTRDVWLATVARKFLVGERGERNFVCVGDRVLCRPADESERQTREDLPQCAILHRTPRNSTIARLDPGHAERMHVLASNVDHMLVVASYLAPKVRWGLIDRCLVMAEYQGIPASIVLNKSDLLATADQEFVDDCARRIENYRSIGYPVYSLQLNGEGVTEDPQFQRIVESMHRHINLVMGHSGVGKSSLVNHLRPELEQMVEPESDIFYKGRHTTTFASLLRLGVGGYVVDTPGVRSFAIGEIDAIQLTHCFRDFRPYLGRCKFRECQHVDQPDCAVREAVDLGHIAAWRYRSFLGILSGETGREGRVRELDLDDSDES